MYKNFTLEEFARSGTADRLRIDNTPPQEVVAHIGELVGSILQPLRDSWGKPIVVTSGYRCNKLNDAVGGVKNSAHLSGYAADVQPNDMSDFGYFVDYLTAFVQGRCTRFDQIIIEESKSAKWVHIAVRDNTGKQRMQLFGMKV